MKELKKLKNLILDGNSNKIDEILTMTTLILKARGHFIYTMDKEAFYYDGKENQLYRVLDKEFAVWLSIEFGFVRSDRITNRIIIELETHAFQHGKKVRFRKFTFFDHISYTLYIHKGDGKMFRLDGERFSIVNMGVDGIYFIDPPHYQPIEYETASEGLMDKILFGDISFAKESLLEEYEQTFVLKYWFLSTFFQSLLPAKPILVLYGPPDSGKTEAVRRLPRFLFGDEANVNSPPNTVKDLRVIADKAHIILLDDIDRRTKAIESELVRMATGVRVDERTLHTNKGVSSLVPDAFVAMTTKTPHFTREDLIQRIFVLWLDKNLDNISAEVIQRQVLENRDRMWAELLMELLEIVKRLRERRNDSPIKIKFRNAGWAEFVFKATPKEAHKSFATILQKLNEDQIRFLLESNPLAKALSLWLKKKGNLGRWVESGELRKELKKIAYVSNLDSTIYGNDQKYGIELKNVTSTFSRIFVVDNDRPRGRNKYHFRKR